jgi:hypothetical protein
MGIEKRHMTPIPTFSKIDIPNHKLIRWCQTPVFKILENPHLMMILINIAVFPMQKEQNLGHNSRFFSNALKSVQGNKMH